MNDSGYDFICPICNANLNDAVKILGLAAWDFHLWIHDHIVDKKEIERLKRGLEYIRDAGFGCAKEAQKIIDGAEY